MQTEFESVPFRMHPRIFAALGADLVTNDVVAVIELVKNSYDAFALNVWIRFSEDEEIGPSIEIQDDGLGMTEDVITDVWCMVATPYKDEKANRLIRRGKKVRRVVGEKGLGRLSVARLGKKLQILTQAPSSECFELIVDWSELERKDSIDACSVNYRVFSHESPFSISGTLIRISEIEGVWDKYRLSELEENLARFISPFSQAGEFNIYLQKPGDLDNLEVKIEPPEFLNKPKYSLNGSIDLVGNLQSTYKFQPIRGGKPRTKKIVLSREHLFERLGRGVIKKEDSKTLCSGPFSFEIRAWDIGPDDTQEIYERFDYPKSLIRDAIRTHKGISVYRDGVLVLPKSENSRDWLGLDLRRVSRVGPRLGTSQIVGYVSITADGNQELVDTSDRENFMANRASTQFTEILNAIVELLEIERNEDRRSPSFGKPMDELFKKLTADDVVAEVKAMADEGAEASETLPVLKAFSVALDETKKEIQNRFVYYSRLATVGTIAHMLVHEIRNRTIAFGSFLEFSLSRFGPIKDKEFEKKYHNADNATDTLERLADKFAPLANRAFRRRLRNTVLEDIIRESVELLQSDLQSGSIDVRFPDSTTRIAVDPADMQIVLMNLLTNAIYWLGEVPKDKRLIEFKIAEASTPDRVLVIMRDTGLGVAEEDIEKIFWPGVTRKPGGIGMGLTVASELVAEYGGIMAVLRGQKHGATFQFDFPLKQ